MPDQKLDYERPRYRVRLSLWAAWICAIIAGLAFLVAFAILRQLGWG